MATIRTAIQMVDGMSPVIRGMTNALNIVISSFEQMQRASANSVDTSSIQAARRELSGVEASFNQVESSIRNSNNQQQQFNNSIQQGQSSADGLLGKIKGFLGVYAGIQGIKMIVGASDEMTQTTARLNMMNDGLQTTEQLQEMIFQSAQRSRAVYSDTANAVAQLGIRAKDAFSSNAEVVAFSETLNKMFTIAGASQQEMSSATLQLTQALGSGVLRGEEFNAVFEAAPNVMQAVADYMGKPIGQLRNMASEGEISADIVKNALFAAADETNTKFNSMPMTWAQVWVEISNTILKASQPILTAINWIANNLDIIGPIIMGIATIVGIYMIATYGVAAATWIWTQAQSAFNAVMALNPIVLIIMAIVLLIAIIYAAVAAVNKFTGSSYSATGFIAGCFTALAAIIYNIIAYLWNVIAAFVEFFANVFTNPVYSVRKLFANLATNVLDICISMTSGFDSFATNLANSVISGVNIAIRALDWFIEMANKLPGVDIPIVSEFGQVASVTSSLESAKTNVNDWAGEAPSDYWTVPKMDMKSVGGAFDTGYDWGYGKSHMFDNLKMPGEDGKDSTKYDDLLANTKDTANNTGKMKDAMDITDEDLKYLRDIAEQDAINRFTTAEVKVDMVNHNNIGNDMDLDGIIDTLGQGVYEGLQTVAEGATYDV